MQIRKLNGGCLGERIPNGGQFLEAQPAIHAPTEISPFFSVTVNPVNRISSALPNLNLYWLTGTGLAFWLLAVHTPPFLRARPDLYRSVLFLFHLVGAGGVYLACIHNTLITPSMWKGVARTHHVWVGRIGLVLGFIGFIAGFVLTWFRRNPNLGFAIPISIGGCLQMISQYQGYWSIQEYIDLKAQIVMLPPSADPQLKAGLTRRKSEALRRHVFNMISLFFLGCGIPAIIRLLDGNHQIWHFVALIALAQFLAFLYATNFVDSKKASGGEEVSLGEQHEMPTFATPLL
jgi:hypothetical protein